MADGAARRTWGGSLDGLRACAHAARDLALVAGVAGLGYGAYRVGGEWHQALHRTVAIDLSPWALPWYAFLSLSRGMLAYAVSLLFTLAYGYWAAKDRRAERVLIPLLDILQSIPVLGFMPGLVIALVALFPHSNVGLELAAVLMIFTGQAWNMTFSFYRSLQSVPRELQESSAIFGFSRWQRFRQIELPSATLGLVWNSMMSMAGGWFFLMVSEAFTLGDQDYRLPGIGSYMSEASKQADTPAMLWGILAMVLMIVTLDQLLWRPLVVWAQRFRVDEVQGQAADRSWLVEWIARSRLRRMALLAVRRWRLRGEGRRRPRPPRPARVHGAPVAGRLQAAVPVVLLAALVLGLGWGLWSVIDLVLALPGAAWGTIAGASGLTFARVLAATVIGTLWTVPVGLAIGLSPRLSRLLQPVIQVAASFPAPMLFPLVVGGLDLLGVQLGIGSVLLMLLGTQWYILFNVIAGAMAIPADLREAFRAYRITGWQRFRQLYVPAIFPYLVTGWVTAMGGAWNASIIAEYVNLHERTLLTHGIGSIISQAAAANDKPLLAASVGVMALLVVGINRLAWSRLYRLGETRFSFDK